MDTPEILFQYLKDVIYNTEKASLDATKLPSEFQKLGQGMQLLGQWVKEARRFSIAMSKGDLSYNDDDPENVFTAPMKDFQSTLRHLTWQTQQVAQGDYSQTVDFMGEFSEGFNIMTKQLKERREALISEKQQIEEKNIQLEGAFELAMAFANHTHNMVIIYSLDGYGVLFQNKFAAEFLESRPEDGRLLREKLAFRNEEKMESAVVWRFEINSKSNPGEKDYFKVESCPILWRQQRAVAHIVTDDTERTRNENRMYELAYADALTGFYNQRYATDQMHSWIDRKVPFVLSFIDVDYLKYCNDTQGHKSGDNYLLEIARALETVDGVHCRTGGDEFMIMHTETTAKEQDAVLERVREKKLEEYIILADMLMYKYKAKNRKPLEDVAYRDDRKLNK